MEVLDQQAVNLAKAIRQVETGGDPKARGGSGEFGAYQFMPDTWKKTAPKYGVNVDLEKSTLEDQNKVAYHQIKEWKDQGMGPDAIASMWNSGKPNYEGNVGVNKKGIKYDVPKYVSSVGKAYQTIKGGGNVGVDPNNPSSLTGTQTGEQPQPKEGILSKIGNALTQSEQNLGKDIGRGILGGDKYFKDITDQYTKNVDTLTALAAKQTNPAMKQKYLDMAKSDFEEGQKVGADFKGRTWEQIAGDVAGVGLDVGATVSGLGAVKALEGASAGQKILKGATTGLKFGAAYGLAGGLQENKDVTGIAKSGLMGGLIGGATGGTISAAGEVVNKIAGSLPQRFLKGVFGKGISNDSVDYALTRKLGNPARMLEDSKSSLGTIGKTIGEMLDKPEYKIEKVTAQDILPAIMNDFPHAGLNPENIVKKLIDIAPNEQDLVLKLVNGGLDLGELQKLKSAIGSNTYKNVFDSPTTKAGKDIGNSFYQFAKEYIQKNAPETTPFMEQYQLEKGLKDALVKVVRNKERSKVFNLRDLMAIIAGMSTAGPVGAGVAYAGEKALTSPTANLKIGGLISKLGNNATLEKGGILTNLLAAKAAGASQK